MPPSKYEKTFRRRPKPGRPAKNKEALQRQDQCKDDSSYDGDDGADEEVEKVDDKDDGCDSTPPYDDDDDDTD